MNYVVVKPPSRVQSFATPLTGLPVPHHFPEFAQVHVHRISDANQPSHPLTLFSPSANIRHFSNESSVHIR